MIKREICDFSPLSELVKRDIEPQQLLFKRVRTVKLAFKHPAIVVGSIILAIMLLIAVFGPLISPYTFSETHLSEKNLPPTAEHIFGTDDLGRDLFTRCCYGIRISLFIGIAAACIDIILGVSCGMIAGFCGGQVDHILMRFADLVYSLPYLLFVIIVTAIMGPGFMPIFAAMIMLGWIQMARIVRAKALQVKSSDYIAAVIALGVKPTRIIRLHIFPNIAGPVIATMMLSIPHAIFTESFLSFLGIGIQPPLASLGSMVSDAIPAMRYYPWRLFIPALLITLIIFSFNLIGDALRDLLDPYERYRFMQDVVEEIPC